MSNLNQCTKTKPKATFNCKNCSCVCVHIVVYNCCVHNAAQNSSDNFLTYAPDKLFDRRDVHWKKAKQYFGNIMQNLQWSEGWWDLS